MDSAVLSALIGGSVALVGAFGGAFISNHFAENRISRQLLEDGKKDKRKLILSKAEELHILISKWSKYISNTSIVNLQYFSGKYDLNKYYEVFNSLELESGTHDKIEAFIFLYFPELESNLLEVKDLLKMNNSSLFRFIDGKISSMEACESTNKCSSDLERKLSSLNKKLTEKVKGIIL